MKNVLVFDDEPQAAASIQAMVMQHPRSSELAVQRVCTLTQLHDYLQKSGYPHILIADILMPEGSPDGIEIVEKF